MRKKQIKAKTTFKKKVKKQVENTICNRSQTLWDSIK